ncbi:trypsin-like serine protease [Bowmanella denitrificans]|uniref:trypsin-like serine protease n=1 Tax=Bowmanella denitrificans TaxID=366582 RepID=UPI000C99DBB6|nr:trypsin-like serine protease [Bowmanella denitrificans]
MNRSTRKKLNKVTRMLCEGKDAKGLTSRDRQQAAHLQHGHAAWLEQANVQGLAVDTKKVAFQDTGQPCIQVYVDKKRPVHELSEPIPQKLQLEDGSEVPLDVQEIGQLQLHNQLELPQRPVFAGLSVASIHRYPGTIGLIVQSINTPGDKYILSCAHVLSPFSDQQDKRVLQPAPQDFSQAEHDFTVADYVASIPLYFSTSGYPNRFDAALAKLRPGVDVLAELPYIGALNGVSAQIRHQAMVRMVGKVSGFSSGTVLNNNFYARLPYYNGNGQKFQAGFRELVLCSRYAQPGDSGAAIVGPGGRLLGIHMAGSNSHSVFCRILPVLQYFQVSPLGLIQHSSAVPVELAEAV